MSTTTKKPELKFEFLMHCCATFGIEGNSIALVKNKKTKKP
jgi:hypothetical protein